MKTIKTYLGIIFAPVVFMSLCIGGTWTLVTVSKFMAETFSPLASILLGSLAAGLVLAFIYAVFQHFDLWAEKVGMPIKKGE